MTEDDIQRKSSSLFRYQNIYSLSYKKLCEKLYSEVISQNLNIATSVTVRLSE